VPIRHRETFIVKLPEIQQNVGQLPGRTLQLALKLRSSKQGYGFLRFSRYQLCSQLKERAGVSGFTSNASNGKQAKSPKNRSAL